MATFRLEFELDSDVYPELHRALVGLRSSQAQAERIRQLAAQGLVWENVRIYGAHAIGPTPTEALDASPSAATASLVSPPVAAPAAPTRTPAARSKRGTEPAAARPEKEPRARAEPSERRSSRQRSPDFVDLAIDAVPTETFAEPGSHGSLLSRSELEQMARELPVLMDVVTETDMGDSNNGIDDSNNSNSSNRNDAPTRPGKRSYVDIDISGLADGVDEGADESDTHASEAPPLYVVPPPPVPAEAPVRKSPRATSKVVQEDPPPEPAVHSDDDAIHLKSLAQKPAARSRLLRMKERGLFKNG